MSSTDTKIVQILEEEGCVEPGEFVADAVLIYATCDPDDPGRTGYGLVALGGSIPDYRLRGLMGEITEMRRTQAED